MTETQEQDVRYANPPEARGATLKEKVKNLDAAIKVVKRRGEIADALEDAPAVILDDGVPEGVDVKPLKRLAGSWKLPAFVSAPADAGHDERIFGYIEESINNRPEELRPILRAILEDAKSLRKLYPHRPLNEVKLAVFDSGTEPEDWHKDGDPGIVRVMKSYSGPNMELADDSAQNKIAPDAGTVIAFKTGAEGPLHRTPGVPKGQLRVALRLEFGTWAK